MKVDVVGNDIPVTVIYVLDNRLWSWYERPRFKASETEKCPRL